MQSVGYPSDRDTVHRCAEALVEAKLSLARAMLLRCGGDWSPDAALATFPEFKSVAAPSAPEQGGCPKVSELVEPFFAARLTVDNTRHQVMGQERSTLRRFMEVCGDRRLDAFGRGDFTTFVETLRRVPNTYGRSPKDKDRPLAEIISAGEAAGAGRLMEKTIKRHMTALSQFFRFAMDKGHVTNAQRTEWLMDHRFRAERGARDQRDAWEPADLTTLFSSPVWTGCHPHFRPQAGSEIIKDARFWLPILALFHGGRLEEFADLYRRDVQCIDGTWCMNIVETEGNQDSGDRTLKNPGSVRRLPMHPMLMRLGFLGYVKKAAPKPDDPVFHDLKPQGLDLKRGPRITRWFVEYRRAVGVYRKGVGIHSMRHNAITRLGNTVTTYQQKRQRDLMMGHGDGGGWTEDGGTEGDIRYDKGLKDPRALKAAAATLALLEYPEVDLTHLYVDEVSHPA